MYHQYTPERLERKAEEILLKYKNGLLLTAPQAMDVDDFAEFYCDATIDFAYLSQDGLTLGCSCFNDGILTVWDDTRTKEIPIDVAKGYILIDKSLLDSEIEGRIRFTIIHECSHLILHPRFLYQKPGTVISKIDCVIYRIENWTERPPMTDEEIREWQANRLGAALIMPRKTIEPLLLEHIGVSFDKNTPICVSPKFVAEMANTYRVSKSAMANRIRDLSFLLR